MDTDKKVVAIILAILLVFGGIGAVYYFSETAPVEEISEDYGLVESLSVYCDRIGGLHIGPSCYYMAWANDFVWEKSLTHCNVNGSQGRAAWITNIELMRKIMQNGKAHWEITESRVDTIDDANVWTGVKRVDIVEGKGGQGIYLTQPANFAGGAPLVGPFPDQFGPGRFADFWGTWLMPHPADKYDPGSGVGTIPVDCMQLSVGLGPTYDPEYTNCIMIPCEHEPWSRPVMCEWTEASDPVNYSKNETCAEWDSSSYYGEPIVLLSPVDTTEKECLRAANLLLGATCGSVLYSATSCRATFMTLEFVEMHMCVEEGSSVMLIQEF